jgi:CBS domain-containing protein
VRAEEDPMQTIKEILNSKGHEVWSVSPNETVLTALKLMAEREIGAVLCLDGEKLVGIITERDYARKVVLLGRSSREAKVSEIMTSHVVCVAPERTVEECMALMTDKRLRHLPVIEHKRVIGVVSIGDLVKATIADQEFMIAQLQSYIAG